MSTTTPGAIRDIIIARIAGTPPTLPPSPRFVAHREELALRDWASANPAACMRRFTVEMLGDTTDPVVSSTLLERVGETFEIVIAYPASARFANRLGLFDVIAGDCRLVTYYAGTNGFSVTPTADAVIVSESWRREERPGVVFGVVPLAVSYQRANP